jgi:ADP-ribosyl-[dinitrogen reductase] hydrolase
VLGAVAGDIIGSRFEGHRSPPRDFALFHPDCRFTDDTVCSFAVADALLGDRNFAASLRAFVRRYPDRGCGGMFLAWTFAKYAPAYGSWSNGAAMRVAAVGWLARNEDEALAWAEAQAAVSHDHPDAVAAAQAVALAIFLARQKSSSRDSLRRRLAHRFGYDLTPERAAAADGFDLSAAGTVRTALTAALDAEGWEGAVRAGGDTDSLACIAGAGAEAIHGVPAEILKIARSYLTPDLTAVLERFETVIAARS